MDGRDRVAEEKITRTGKPVGRCIAANVMAISVAAARSRTSSETSKLRVSSSFDPFAQWGGSWVIPFILQVRKHHVAS